MKFKTKKISTLLVALPTVFFSASLLAQDVDNLVGNPGFEKADTKKLRKIGDIDRADGWISATPAKADLYASDAKVPDVMVPENIYGSEEAKEGSNYAGIIAYSYREKESRSYLQAQLKTPMKKGMRYQVQFFVSLAELSKYSSNRLGAVFSKKPLGGDKKVPAIIMGDPHVEHPDKKILTATFGWDLICNEYVAEGGEKFITIGNFSAEEEIKTDRVSKPRNLTGRQIIAAYYYIDDISVKLLEPNEKCDCNYGQTFDEEPSTVYQRSPEITKNMTLDQTLKQYDIYYAEGRYDVRVDGKKTLDAIIKIMNENPKMKLQIRGHIDENEAGTPGMKNVGIKRADYIRDLLIEEGIDENRIYSSDSQDKKPSQFITDDDDEKLRSAKNRRVSFEIL